MADLNVAADLDVAIIGAGVSGLYCAWRLLETGAATKVEVFEADDRIGGRLLSATPPGVPDMVAELGGMRILPAVQPRIGRLLEVLNTPPIAKTAADLIETFPMPVDQPENIAFIRGRHLRLEAFNQPDQVPFNLGFQEVGKTAGALVVQAIEQILPGITDASLTEDDRRAIAHTATFDGQPLYQQGFWQVLLRVMSSEAYQLALAAGGYQTSLSNWNAADAIPWFLSDFGIDPDYRGFSDGFQQVPIRLAQLVEQAGGAVNLSHRLKCFEVGDDGGATLLFADDTSVTADRLILAMPRRGLELLSLWSPALQGTEVQRLIRSVSPQPLFKLFTTYAQPWWRAANCLEGRSTTDLPIRQTYYWPQQDGTPSLGGPSMLMASYDDGLNIGFWDGFRAKRGRNWEEGLADITDPDWFVGAELGEEWVDPEWGRNRAPRLMVEEVERQLAIMHGVRHVPDAQQAAFKDWGDDPHGGGWNSWNIGVRSTQVRDKILKPLPDANVHVCGEAYSDAQGWVEGALQTADMLLDTWFDVAGL